MSLTSLLRDPQSPVRAYLDGISPFLEALSGRSDRSRAAAKALGLSELAGSRTLVSPFPGTDLGLAGTAFDFRARIQLGGFDPRRSAAAAGIAQLANYVPFMENGPHRAKILTEAFGVAEALLREPFSDSDLDRASILLAYCEQVARVGPNAVNGSVGVSCDAVVDGASFADQLNPHSLADIRSLMFSNADQFETWHEQIATGDRYEPNPGFAGSGLVGGADADWVIGDTLIDCKVYGTLTVPKLRDFVRQLLGYVMLDLDDSLGIRQVGIWLPRQKLTPSWSLERLLGGDPEELLPSLRQAFIKATGKTQLAPHTPTPTRRKHQLLAENRHTPYEMLAELALSDDVGIRRRAGRNAVTPEATVRKLAEDTRWQVREGVARNEAAPHDVLEVLARDRSSAVRRAVAANPGAPLPLLKVLAADTTPDVQWTARTNDRDGNAVAGSALSPVKQSAAGYRGGIQIRQNRDESALASTWFSDFLQMAWGYPHLPIPRASELWGRQAGRPLAVEDWTGTGLPEEVLADLIREDRPDWVRRMIARRMPISDPAVRDGLLRDADPEIRWLALKRTLPMLDESLSALLADLAATKEARLRFRTEGMGPRGQWGCTAAEYQQETLCLIACHPATPYTTLLALMANPSKEVLAQLIENPSLGTDDRVTLIRSLQTSKSATARELLASSDSVPQTVLIELATDKDAGVRAAVAKHPTAPFAALSRLAEDHHRTVRLSVLQNPATPGDLAGSVAEAMLRIDVDEDLYQVLDLTERRADLKMSPRVIEAALDRLSKSRVRCPDMREIVADDKRTGEKTLSRLARSADVSVRRSVAANSRTSVIVLEQLAGDPEPIVRAEVAGNPLSPASVLEALSQDEEAHVRSRTARNPNLSRSMLEILLLDAEDSVRAAVLQNPATPPDFVLEAELALSARHTRPDRAALAEMVAHKRAEVRMEVAFSPVADADLLALLGGERRSAQVRRAVAANPNTPAAVLGSLSDDKDDQVRQAVAFNGATPETLLAELAGRSIDLAILVAMNPDVPNAVLDALSQDNNPLIRFVAAARRQERTISGNSITQRAPDSVHDDANARTA
ncbi:hypothetical protein LOC59_12390 [Arthrobacter sp. zg-Y916]|uniref:hypothetical protein n=1 Tax=Arthrobacter sp. zg-Y916 TaxID=2894190 RepID=UPI002F42F8E2|nr:hypothetical protein [Arthrobacter sp. zg-Y916]